jgi:hypothetical protein
VPDYKEMYLKMVRASEKAVNILISVQQECEELYLSAPDSKIMELPQDQQPAREDKINILISNFWK